MSAFLLAVRTGFGFLSTIPVGITMEGLDELVKRSYLFTFTGIVLGILMGIFAYVSETIFSPSISAALIIAFVYYLTGLNHLDGVSDFGDGATAHGSLEKKIKALKDMSLGIGGVAYCVIALLALYASITSLQISALLPGSYIFSSSTGILVSSLFVAEVGAKQAMLTIAAFGKPIHEGLGSMLMNSTNMSKYTIGLVMGAIACILAFDIVGLIAFVAAIISALVVMNVSNRHFGGVNGDGIGTANEIARIISLITITLALDAISSGYGGLAWTLL
ncbi:MAG: adenosylcobinamide-GDP ribazoletransferase [Euryarchaeota archaeon]|nr:adenosylcobinamide-GDP ribazoletransferase [Euryarchaeota archaeon]